MCGIVGFVHRNAEQVGSIRPETLKRMRDLMAHRGPDDAGLYVSPCGRAGLAHRRLSILDLTPAGHQPMSDRTGRWWIVFNGEIYNYVELRSRLEGLGHRFRSRCDTEVLLSAYIQWGAGALDRLVGMWAFAVWDEATRTFFAARDRFGIKPFYYAIDTTGTLLFASEVRALLTSGRIEPRAHPPSLHAFLKWGMADSFEETFFAGVRRLMPGHCLRATEQGVRVWRYWDIEPAEPARTPSLAEAGDRLRELLSDAVRLRLRSDVPVGTALSGGLDSTTILSLASRMIDHPMDTFTSVFPGIASSDESAYAAEAARHCGASAHTVEPRPDAFFERFGTILSHLEEPTGAPGVYAMWHVMQLAADHVVVLLDGQGGDECLAGYTRYGSYRLASELAGALRRTPGSSWRGVGEQWRRTPTLTPREVIRAVGRGLNPLVDLRWVADRLRNGRGADFLSGEAAAAPVPEVSRPMHLGDPLANRLYWDVTRDVLPALLRFEDKLSMAFSLEARVPMTDHRVVEYLLGLPARYLMHDGWTKRVLRVGLRHDLPKAILNRRDKMGYEVPTHEWFSGILAGGVEQVLFDRRTLQRGWLDPVRLRRAVTRHQRGARGLARHLWRALVLELWTRLFVDAPFAGLTGVRPARAPRVSGGATARRMAG